MTTILLIIWLGVFSADIGRSKYYSDDNKYQVIEGEVLDYSFNYTYITIAIGVFNNIYFTDNYFIINGDNHNVVLDNVL